MASVNKAARAIILVAFVSVSWHHSVAAAQPKAPAADRDEPAFAPQTVAPTKTKPAPDKAAEKQAELVTPPPESPVVVPKLQEKEFRFDALRIAGTPGGPEALLLQGWLATPHSPLLKTRRSFLYRVLETVEMPTLHGDGP